MVVLPEKRFLADPTLGKLAKWIRILGLDAQYLRTGPSDRIITECEPDRIVLTRSREVSQRYRERKLIFIQNNDPFEQLKEVIESTGIRRDGVRPFSRCIRCNVLISQVDKAWVKSRVPDYVWQHHHRFHRCDRCGRIYWAGTHIDRSLRRIDALFDTA